MVEIAPFDPRDYDEVVALWSETEGLTLREADSREAIIRYVARNPNLSFVARDGVPAASRRRAIPSRPGVGACPRRTRCRGPQRPRNSEVSPDGTAGECAPRAFWEPQGWSERGDVILMSRANSHAASA